MKELEELHDCLAKLEEAYCSYLIRDNHCIGTDAAIIQIRIKIEDVLARIERLLLAALAGK